MQRRVFFHGAAVLGLLSCAAWFIRPSRDAVIGWGGDPHFNLWTFELVWDRIASHGPLWFLHLPLWRTQLFAGADFGLAYSENQLWTALATYPFFLISGSAPLALQLFVIACAPLTYGLTFIWLRGRMRPVHAAGLALFFAASGWLQSQMGHYQNLCIFVVPLALVAFDRLKAAPSIPRALLLGLAVGWACGWNLYYFVFLGVWCGLLLANEVRRKRLPWRLAGLAAIAAIAVAAPVLRPYLLLDRSLGSHPALECYGLNPWDMFARLHAPRLLWPAYEAVVEPGGMPITWLLLLLYGLTIPRARPWLIAAAAAFWISTGRALGAWGALGWLPVVSALRAIGRVHLMTIALTLPALGAVLQALPSRVAGVALVLLLAESIPGRPAEHVAVEAARPAPEVAFGTDPILVLPPPDSFAMEALLPWRVSYYGGYSGFAPPGEELLEATWRRSSTTAVAVEKSVAATQPRFILSRSPEISSIVRAGISVRREVTSAGSSAPRRRCFSPSRSGIR